MRQNVHANSVTKVSWAPQVPQPGYGAFTTHSIKENLAGLKVQEGNDLTLKCLGVIWQHSLLNALINILDIISVVMLHGLYCTCSTLSGVL